MAYDEELATRVRELLKDEVEVSERRMFGGLAFLIQGNMAIAAMSGGGLMVRLTTDGLSAEVLEDPQVRPVEMRGRKMKNWVEVDSASVSDPGSLSEWVARGVAAIRGLPPKKGR